MSSDNGDPNIAVHLVLSPDVKGVACLLDCAMQVNVDGVANLKLVSAFLRDDPCNVLYGPSMVSRVIYHCCYVSDTDAFPIVVQAIFSASCGNASHL